MDSAGFLRFKGWQVTFSQQQDGSRRVRIHRQALLAKARLQQASQRQGCAQGH